ncbi:FliM/FliN family flagellar motor switch protein [Pontivivens insulae]|uniref:Flagellar motor switch protein FliM n=1 Tax=Pontivivens insulae TaxID=1639689 RepID=A0A2R8A9J9_9RHOB|nr:FliM/FliN family flagellar motor switch protein [Pontivivens insulae]RED12792.1 flagellar motor switch protein FliM [Pontivivens insulae]SPF28883.1 Flagellar motor switch protein FliM [Pontivivens insulae]
MATGEMHRAVLKRKLTNPQVGRAPLPKIDEVAQGFCAQLEKSGRAFFRCDVGAMLTRCVVQKLDATLETIHLPAMLGLAHLEGIQDQALVNLTSDLVYHIVDLRLGGDPNASPAIIARSFTPIDAALATGFVEIVVQEFAISVERVLGLALSERMSFDRMEDNVTQLNLANRAADVLVIEVNLDIGEAARNADVQVVIPLSMLDGIKAASPREVAETDKSRDLWNDQLQRAAQRMQVDLDTVIARKQLALGDLADLEVGTIIDLPRASIDTVELVIGNGASGTFAALGTLGQRAGQKVLRLNEDLTPELKAHLMALRD